MSAVDRFIVAVLWGAGVGLVLWMLGAWLGPGGMGLLFGSIVALALARQRQ